MIPLYEPNLLPHHRAAAIAQIESGWIGPGETCKRFARMIGSRFDRECTLTNSGTSALMLAMLALYLPRGSTIACPDYGLPACHNAARLLGYEVVLIDVDPWTGCMSAAALREYVDGGGRCDAVVFVDHCGYAGSGLHAVKDVCDRLEVNLIEDSAVALGCVGAGVTGDISILSFSVPKVVTTGQGGAVMTADSKLADRLAQLVDQGGGDWRKDRVHSAVGGNFRMTDVQAALGAAQMLNLDQILEHRARLWGWYREGMDVACDVRPSGWMVTARGRDAAEANCIVASVTAAGYECRRLYRPVHHNAPYATEQEFPGATEIYDRLVYLPSSLNLTKNQVREVTDTVARGRT